MRVSAPEPRRRWLVPEVVQTSAMDCGPAALKSLLEGFGVSVSYGRLREACQTAVDGTSISTIQEVAVQLGLEAEEIMLPEDHLLLPEAHALPCLIAVRLPNGFTHFVVLWRRHGPWLQIMDPALGRRWVRVERLRHELYVHRHAVPASGWREWADTEEFRDALVARIGSVTGPRAPDALLAEAATDPTWRSLAALDASTRMVQALIDAGGLTAGTSAAELLRTLFAEARSGATDAVSERYWSVRPQPGAADEPMLLLSGTVLVRVRGRREPVEEVSTLPSELSAALQEPAPRPAWELLRLLKEDGLLSPLFVLCGLAAVSAGLTLEAVLFRALFDIGESLALLHQRLAAGLAVIAFAALLTLIEIPVGAEIFRMGRRIETRLRISILATLPRLSDRYFRSRPVSDMAARAHSIQELRQVPRMGARLVRILLGMVMTVVGIAWLDPRSAPLAALGAVVSVGVPFLLMPLIREHDLRVRTHAGALFRFYLDAMLGLVPVRTHGAAEAVQREHESLLVDWTRAGRTHTRASVLGSGLTLGFGYGVTAALLYGYLDRSQAVGGALLLVYWTLRIPAFGREFAILIRSYPAARNIMLRALEPLGAIEHEEPGPSPPAVSPTRSGLEVRFEQVTVVASGHPILSGIDVSIPEGSHIAVVGPSGAGKSSLLGLLQGWHRAERGGILVDGEPLTASRLHQLRNETAWVDPGVQIWNRSFLYNVRYGATESRLDLGHVIDTADIRAVLEGLPEGMQTRLGEGGGLVSAGEGQRVRLGRAMHRPGARLVILDEPFRGLERERRSMLLQRAREYWSGATLLCVIHDLKETAHFDRVLVMEGGRIVEDGDPEELAERAGSKYRQMLEAERGIWEGIPWRRVRVAEGRAEEVS